MIKIIRTYKQELKGINQAKIDTLKPLFAESLRYMNDLASLEVFTLALYGSFSGTKYLVPLEGYLLSERYKQTLGTQVRSTLNSRMSNLYNRYKEIVYRSNLSNENKRALFFIGKNNLYFHRRDDLKAVEDKNILEKLIKYEVDYDYHFKIARRIFKRIGGLKAPLFNRHSLILDKKVYDLEESKSNKHFSHVLRLSTLERGKKTDLPLNVSSYVLSKSGKDKSAIQISLNSNQKIEVGFIKEVEAGTNSNGSDKEIGIDIGLNSILSTSSGNSFGSEMFEKLKAFDKTHQNIIKGSMKRGHYEKTKRQNELDKKIRSFVKNEIGRAVNNMLLTERPDVIYIEAIKSIATHTRQNGGLSKTMRRLLLRSGFSLILNRLKMTCEELGIDVREVPAAYTSQTCLSCGHIHKSNRSGADFKCTRCGKKINADIQGARHIFLRGRSYKDYGEELVLDEYLKHYLIKDKLRSSVRFRPHATEGLFSFSKAFYSPVLNPNLDHNCEIGKRQRNREKLREIYA